MATNYGSLAQEMIDAGLSPALAKLIANAIANAATPQFTIGSDRVDATPADKLRLVTADTRRYELTNLDYSPTTPFAARLDEQPNAYEPPAVDHPYKDSQPVNVSPTLARPAVVGSDYIDVERSVNGDTAVSVVKLNLRTVGGPHPRLDTATKTLDSVPITAVSQTPKYLTAEVDESPSATEVRLGVRAIEQVDAVLSDGSTRPMVAWPAGSATANGAFTSYAKNTLFNKTSNAELQQAIGSPAVWVNFQGHTASDTSATYTRAGTTVTVTLANHGYLVNHFVYINFITGGALDDIYAITSVTTDTFTVTTTASGTIAVSTCSLLKRAIRSSSNVHSVSYLNSAGNYFLNFAKPLVDADYCVVGGGRYDTDASNVGAPNVGIYRGPSVVFNTGCRIAVSSQTTAAGYNAQMVCVAVFR